MRKLTAGAIVLLAACVLLLASVPKLRATRASSDKRVSSTTPSILPQLQRTPLGSAERDKLPLCPVDTVLEGDWFLPPAAKRISTVCKSLKDDSRACWTIGAENFPGRWRPEDPQYQFRPQNCRLWDPVRSELAELMSDRTIILIGDSISQNHFWDLLCQLETQHGFRPEDDWGGFDIAMPPMPLPHEIASVGQGRCGGPQYIRWVIRETNTAVVHVTCAMDDCPLSYALPYVLAGLRATRRDIVVANHGLHYQRWSEAFASNASATIARLRREQGADAPMFLWRENFPQFFNHTRDGAWIDPGDWQLAGCGPISEPANALNKRTVPFPKAAGIPVLHVYNATKTRWRECAQIMDPWVRSLGRNDCSHFCVPSSLLRYLSILFWHHVRLLSGQV